MGIDTVCTLESVRVASMLLKETLSAMEEFHTTCSFLRRRWNRCSKNITRCIRRFLRHVGSSAVTTEVNFSCIL